jgi:hypothetical protein
MSEVSICNLALSHLGDTSDVTSISPPENSVQAQLCAQFYPIARDALLEMGSWGFATRRVKLALLATNPAALGALDASGAPDASTWAYCYAQPAGVINVIAVLSAEASNDYESNYGRAIRPRRSRAIRRDICRYQDRRPTHRSRTRSRPRPTARRSC